MRRFPPYMIIAVCGILFLSAGMVIITADNTDQTAPVPAPTDASAGGVTSPVEAQPTVIPLQPTVEQPTVVPPTVEQAAPVVVPTEIIQPTTVVQQNPQPTAVIPDQLPAQPTMSNALPVPPVNANPSQLVVTPVLQQPNEPLGTLPPSSNISPTAEVPVIIPTVVLPTARPTVVAAAVGPQLMQLTGQVGTPLRTDSSGIAVTIILPDGSAQRTTTDGAGHFTFNNLPAGAYHISASAPGYLSNQTTFTLTAGQNMALPSAMLVGGDTNLDNKIDLTDASLIAANFDSTSVVAGADLNHDGVVDIRDLTAIGAYFGLSGPTPWQP